MLRRDDGTGGGGGGATKPCALSQFCGALKRNRSAESTKKDLAAKSPSAPVPQMGVPSRKYQIALIEGFGRSFSASAAIASGPKKTLRAIGDLVVSPATAVLTPFQNYSFEI